MENQSKDANLRQLAVLFRSILTKNTEELHGVFENEQAENLLEKLTPLIGTSQTSIAQQKAENSAWLSQNAVDFADLTERQSQLTAQVNQINGDINSQEERKSCNF